MTKFYRWCAVHFGSKNFEKIDNYTMLGLIIVLALLLFTEFSDFIAEYSMTVFGGLFKLLITFGLIVAVPVFGIMVKSNVNYEVLNDKKAREADAKVEAMKHNGGDKND